SLRRIVERGAIGAGGARAQLAALQIESAARLGIARLTLARRRHDAGQHFADLGIQPGAQRAVLGGDALVLRMVDTIARRQLLEIGVAAQYVGFQLLDDRVIPDLRQTVGRAAVSDLAAHRLLLI